MYRNIIGMMGGHSGGGGGAFCDTDANAFLSATGLGADTTIHDAICDLVIDLKAASLWTKFIALYPFVGGTADTHKYNLKNPQNTDAAFRIAWNGTVTHNANGITGNGSTGYGDTKINPSTHTTINDLCVSMYCRTVGGASDSGYDFGGNNGGSSAIQMILQGFGETVGMMYRADTADAFVTKVEATAQGFYSFSRRSSTAFEGYKNGTSFQTRTDTNTGTLPNTNMFVLAISASGTAGNHSNHNLALLSVSTGLTDTEASDLNTIVQAFQTALSRNV